MQGFKKLFIQFFKFGIIGAINTFLSYGIFIGMHRLAGANEIFSNITAFVVCTAVAFVLQVKFVFKGKKQNKAFQLVKSYTVYGFSNGLLETFIISFCMRKLMIVDYIAKIIPMCITIPTNFLLHKFWVYSEKLDLKA